MASACTENGSSRSDGSGGNLSTPASGVGQRKTFIVMVTIIGCLAIMWPKVFYPMMFGGPQVKPLLKDHRGTGCCDVVIDSSTFANVSNVVGQSHYRRHFNLATGEMSVRQERPPHMIRPEAVHPAMRERGRAIPSTQTIPIVERPYMPPMPPRIIEGRPGPIPGMRPPMGAGSVHQSAPPKMGLIMPLYTVGIVAFFVYTIMRIVYKKSATQIAYGEPIKPDPTFRQEVFATNVSSSQQVRLKQHQPQQRKHDDLLSATGKHTENGQRGESSKLDNDRNVHLLISANALNTPFAMDLSRTSDDAMTTKSRSDDMSQSSVIDEKEQLMEINLLRRKLQETEIAMAKIIAQLGNVPRKGEQEHEDKKSELLADSIEPADESPANPNASDELNKSEKSHGQSKDYQSRDTSADRGTVKIMGMEMTASVEGGHKWSRPATPVLGVKPNVARPQTPADEKQLDPQEIYLEGSLPHESKILVSDAEYTTETMRLDNELDWEDHEPAVVLSSKMTLSLINLDPVENIDEPSVEKFILQNKSSNGDGTDAMELLATQEEAATGIKTLTSLTD